MKLSLCARSFLPILGLLAAVCPGPAAEPVPAQPSEIACYGTRYFSRTLYLGADPGFHYFFWRHGLRSGSFKVPRSALVLKGEFPRGTGEAFVKHDADAALILYGFRPARK